MDELHLKQQKLESYLKEAGKIAVAFSGGVDSTYLLYEANKILGENVLAVTAKICSFPEKELSFCVDFCKEHNIKHSIREIDLLKIPEFKYNHPERCYYCKKEIFKNLINEAEKYGFTSVAEGSNTDDVNDYRPGRRALKEAGALSPLEYAGLTKADIRSLSEEAGLPTFNKPALACLATRFETGEEITPEKLTAVNRAEEKLRGLGFYQVRVRLHKNLARIEIPAEDFEKIFRENTLSGIRSAFSEYGFDYVTLDLNGYVTGSMNKAVNPLDKNLT